MSDNATAHGQNMNPKVRSGADFPSAVAGRNIHTYSASGMPSRATPVADVPDLTQHDYRNTPRIINIALNNDGAPLSNEFMRDSLNPLIGDALGDGSTIDVRYVIRWSRWLKF